MRSALFLAPALATSVVASSLLNEFQKRAGVVYPSQCSSSCSTVNHTLSTNATLPALCTPAFQTDLYNCLECTVQFGGALSEATNIQADDQVLAGLQSNCASASLSIGAAKTLTSFSSLPTISSSTSSIANASMSSTASVSSTAASVSSTSTVTGGGFASSTSTSTTATAAATTTKSGDVRMEPSVMAAWGMGLAVLGIFLMS